ncbi:MAG: DAK2 domain-containing protein [Syntrophomonadaceae bacterium]|nr:DAK2 domain-containing protein [Syntrophomonadaceae bacterium]
MALLVIDGNDLVRSLKAGCINLEHQRDAVDLLNVFPVPDGDTGTNMYLTLLSAVKEGEKNINEPVGKVAKAISRGSLMGARGNSGVILSQIFRGFARVLEGKEKADAMDLALALKAGSQTAYDAVMKPVEGTILTVVREVSATCEAEAQKGSDVIGILVAGIATGNATLAKTPSMLPILKEAGVVDSGGQGFMYFLEGLLQGLAQEKEIELGEYREKLAQPGKKALAQGDQPISLEYQYCNEVLIKGSGLKVDDIRDHLGPLGDSMLVVGDEEIVKVHIHSNHPGKVLETCLQFGQLSDIKINNMLEEVHEHINNWKGIGETDLAAVKEPERKQTGLVAVAAGDGIIAVLKSLGVDEVVEGGQTMNPSTEDLLNACNLVNADAVIILPNNGNVIMSAQQVVGLSEKKVRVVPSRSVMQAISALITYDSQGDADQMADEMTEIAQSVAYGEVTYAIRDSNLNGLEIKEGDTIGLVNDQIVLTAADPADAVVRLLEPMVADSGLLITLFYGEGISEAEAGSLAEKISAKYESSEVETHYGGQPLYSYLLSVE